jgi:glycosyltransferase involved in cell wall biosynthesis
MLLKVLVNAGPLVNRPLTGVGQYTYQLYRELLALQTPCRFYYRYHFSDDLKVTGNEFADSFERLADATAVTQLSLKVARKLSFLSSTLGLGKADIYHEPNFLPFKTHLASVITIHDLSPLRVPETHRAKPVEIFRQRMPRAVERAKRIIAVSEFTRREIIEYFPEAESKTFVTLEGVRDNYQPMSPEATAPYLKKMGLTHGRYLLAVGTLEPRKNLARAITAYCALPQKTRKHYPLAIAGMKGWLNHEFEAAITQLVDAGEAKILGFVPDESMNALYAGARLLVYPSIYEGFGLPPLEAMACGTPVITANCSSLPEVVGDAGIQIDPYDCDAIHAALASLIEDDGLHQRLSQVSIQRAKTFTWRRTAEETLKIFEDLSAELTG